MPNCVVIIPTYNEAQNLPVLAAELWALQIPGLVIVVVDDNSPDGTGAIADEMAGQRPGELFVLHQDKKKGIRRAFISGFKWALDKGAEYIIQMDSDFSHSPRHIPDMLEAIKNADLVVGSRYVAGGKVDDRVGASGYLLSYWANAVYTSLILNMKVTDATSGYKCWRAGVLRAINLQAISTDGYSFQIEMTFVAEKLGYRVVEIPIQHEARRTGREKLRLRDKLDVAVRAWLMRWRYKGLETRPDAAAPNETIAADSSNGANPSWHKTPK